MDCDASKKTILTDWFTANCTIPTAKQHSYLNFLHHFVWEKKSRKWKSHSQANVIARMYFVHPSTGERIYLRLLLITVKGPESWEDLRRFQGVLYPMFKAACVIHGLLEDDGEWKKCLEEAGDMQTGQQLRSLFVTILLHCHPSQPHVLWNQFRVKICDDLNHRLTAQGHLDPTEDDTFDYGLHLIQRVLMQSGRNLRHYPDMPLPQQNWDDLVPNPLLQEQLAFDRDEMSNMVNQNYPHFNPEQKLAFDNVIDSAKNNKGKIFTVLEVVERPMSVIQLLLQFV